MLATNAPLEALIPSWQRALRAENKPKTTLKTYQIGVTRFLTYLRHEQHSTLVGEIQRSDIQGFVAKLLELDYAPSTAAIWLSSVQSLCTWLVEEGEIAVSPAEHVAPPKLPERYTRTLSEDEAKRLIHACSGNDFISRRDEALIRLAIDSGMRESELGNLKLSEVHLDDGMLRIIGKGDNERLVGFGAKTARAIDRYLRLRSAHRCADLPWLWIGHTGRLVPKGIYQRVVARGEEAGLGHVRPHMLRHTWADMCQRNGMQWSDMKQLGGWKSDTIAGKYGASLRAERAVAAHKIYGPGDRL